MMHIKINSVIKSIPLNSPFKVAVLYQNYKEIYKGKIMQFAHGSTSADPAVRPDRAARLNPAMKQILNADRCTAVDLGDLDLAVVDQMPSQMGRLDCYCHTTVHPEFSDR